MTSFGAPSSRRVAIALRAARYVAALVALLLASCVPPPFPTRTPDASTDAAADTAGDASDLLILPDAPHASCDADLIIDPNNCGACGVVCGPRMICSDGNCVCDDSVLCNGVCVDTDADLSDCAIDVIDGPPCAADLTIDPNNCGACGNVCGPGMTCSDGNCVCADGVFCNGQCVASDADLSDCAVVTADAPPCNADLIIDPNNCGACGNVCGTGMTCSDGSCVCADGVFCNGVCVEAGTDLSDCGWFGSSPSPCDADLIIDPNNCGMCGVVCGPGRTCSDGNCVCANGIDCNGTCVDIANDPLNCGACGHVCLLRATCIGGRCQ